MTGSSVRPRPARSAKPGGWAVAAGDRLARGGRDGVRGHRLGAALVSPGGQRAMIKAAAAGVAAAVAVGVHARWVRPRVVSWGATGEEAGRPMVGDELGPRPQLNATRAVTITAAPEHIWPWLVQWGWNRAGFTAMTCWITELILMEIGDPFMMRKCLLGIKQRAEQRAARRRFQR
jgi:hypothetical protein